MRVIKELYFPLEDNIMYNERIARMVDQCGAEGFGIYMILLIELHHFDAYRMGEYSIKMITKKHRLNKRKLDSVLHDFDLFECSERDGAISYSSPYMDRVMLPLENYRKKHFQEEKKKPATTVERGANGRFTAKNKPTVTVEPAVHGTSTVNSPTVKKSREEESREENRTEEKTTTAVVEKKTNSSSKEKYYRHPPQMVPASAPDGAVIHSGWCRHLDEMVPSFELNGAVIRDG